MQVLTVIGEGFDAELSEDIAGLVLSTRRQADRISMWTKTSADEPLQKRIGYVRRARAYWLYPFFLFAFWWDATVPYSRGWMGFAGLSSFCGLLDLTLGCCSAAVGCRCAHPCAGVSPLVS